MISGPLVFHVPLAKYKSPQPIAESATCARNFSSYDSITSAAAAASEIDKPTEQSNDDPNNHK